MARIKKKGTSGATNNYLTRSQAVRKLQLPLGDFRRLCIFKGIYPREPSSRSKKRVSKSATPNTTFYYAKDIQYLLHEPLLDKLREKKALEKKIAKALGRGDLADATRWERDHMPRMKLDHIVKERYPTFVDALRDLDDALSMLYLFASIPSTPDVPTKLIARCHRLTLEWEHYLIRAHALRKSFLSIKGIYYQATIQGQDIMWLVPYKFVLGAGGVGDVIDWRIMRTFVEFYTTLLGFVNFRLFTGLGLVYPPRFDADAEEKGAELGAVRVEGKDVVDAPQSQPKRIGDAESNERAQAEADRLLTVAGEEQDDTPEITSTELDEDDEESAQPSTALDQFAPIDEKADALLQPSLTADASAAGQLFEPFTFFLSRETPRHPLEFILKAFGCKRVGWDSTLGDPGAYCSEDDPRVTHQVVDRPDLPLPSPPLTDGDDDEDAGAARKRANERVPGRIYIQPQWVWDCINAGQLQRPDMYAPGATLPPHLSPWVKAKKGEYDPTLPLAEQETAEEAEIAGEIEAEEAEEDDIEEGSEGEEVDGVRGDQEARELEEDLELEEEDDGGMNVQLAASDEEDESEQEDNAMNGDDWTGFSGDEQEAETEDPARQAQMELEAEALGLNPEAAAASAKAAASSKKQSAQAKRSRAEREKEEEVERRKGMMSRRKRQMFEKMVYSNARKDEEAERLRAKRRKIEKGAGTSRA